MNIIIRRYVSFHLLGSILFLSLVSVGQLWSEDYDFLSSFNVLDYGALGDGITDDTQAFEMTWESTCNAETSSAEMIVPEEMTFLVHSLAFDGPCYPTKISFLFIFDYWSYENLLTSQDFHMINYRKCTEAAKYRAQMAVNIPDKMAKSGSEDSRDQLILGTIVAPDSPDAWEGKDQGRWLIFDDVNGLNVDGPGMIDGQGQGWWDISCKTLHQSTGCVKLAPTVLSFLQCDKVSMRNITVVNSPQTHILISGCDDFTINSLSIRSPGKSPNTDGIHISGSHGVFITSTNIGSGDDCVSIGDHTSNILISDINCGPGHGVSIGSLGKSGNDVKVENISLIRGHFNQTTNGVRIKTWQVGRGHVRGVSFKSVTFTDVKNPIIIDQYYCDPRSACKSMKTGVKINDVHYSGASGTSTSAIAINLNCSQAVPCTNIVLDTIELASSTQGKQVKSSCNNAYGRVMGVVKPKSCLLQQS